MKIQDQILVNLLLKEQKKLILLKNMVFILKNKNKNRLKKMLKQNKVKGKVKKE
jgi:hypothetical protein